MLHAVRVQASPRGASEEDREKGRERNYSFAPLSAVFAAIGLCRAFRSEERELFFFSKNSLLSMPPLTLTSPRVFALQLSSTARLHRADVPPSSTPLVVRQRRRRTESGTIAIVAVALGDGTGVASTSSTSTSSSSLTSSIADAKASLRAAAPAARKGDPVAVASVFAAVERLAELSASSPSSPSSSAAPPFPPPPEPSTWETLYTDAKQGSNGKVGPLQGEARQLFEPGARFLNRVSIPSDSLPLLRADFGGSWAQRAGRRDRVEVIFEESSFRVLGLRVAGSEFPPPGQKGSLKGHWTMKFADDDVRAFVTNKLSVVVLGRVEGK